MLMDWVNCKIKYIIDLNYFGITEIPNMFKYLLIILSLFALTTFSDNRTKDQLVSVSDIAAVILDDTSSLDKKIQSLQLAAKLNPVINNAQGIKFNKAQQHGIIKFILTSLYNKNVTLLQKKAMFQAFKDLGFYLDASEIEEFEKALMNYTVTPSSLPILFDILYCNKYYTEKNRNKLVRHLLKIKTKPLVNPEYIAELLVLLSENTPYILHSSFESSCFSDSATYGAIRNKILMNNTGKAVSKRLCYIFCRIATKNVKVLHAILMKRNDFLKRNWCLCVSFLYFNSLTDYRGGLKIMKVILDELKDNANDKLIVSQILAAFTASSTLTVPYLRDNLPTISEMAQCEDENIADQAKRLINELTINDYKNINTYVEDKTKLERHLFSLLETSHQLNKFKAYNFLRMLALIFDDIKLPTDFQKYLTACKNGSAKEVDSRFMSIFLIQQNPKYKHNQLAFTKEMFKNFDNIPIKVRTAFLVDGVSYHLINNPQIRPICLSLLNNKVNYKEARSIIWLFGNIDSGKKKIALKLINFYSAIKDLPEIKLDSKKSAKLTRDMSFNLKSMFAKNMGTNLKAWKQAIAKMPGAEKKDKTQ